MNTIGDDCILIGSLNDHARGGLKNPGSA